MKAFSKSTKNTKVSENTILVLVKTVDDDIDAFLMKLKLRQKIALIVLKTLPQIYQCSECNAPVTAEIA